MKKKQKKHCLTNPLDLPANPRYKSFLGLGQIQIFWANLTCGKSKRGVGQIFLGKPKSKSFQANPFKQIQIQKDLGKSFWANPNPNLFGQILLNKSKSKSFWTNLFRQIQQIQTQIQPTKKRFVQQNKLMKCLEEMRLFGKKFKKFKNVGGSQKFYQRWTFALVMPCRNFDQKFLHSPSLERFEILKNYSFCHSSGYFQLNQCFFPSLRVQSRLFC